MKTEITKQAVKQVVESMPEGGTSIAVAFEFGICGSNAKVSEFLRELYDEGSIARTITYTDTVFRAKAAH